jgi:hypothetical protein
MAAMPRIAIAVLRAGGQIGGGGNSIVARQRGFGFPRCPRRHIVTPITGFVVRINADTTEKKH